MTQTTVGRDYILCELVFLSSGTDRLGLVAMLGSVWMVCTHDTAHTVAAHGSPQPVAAI